MAAVTTVVEGNIKFREGKKWKSRWCVVKKPSPVADHLQVVLYKNVYESAKPDGKCKSVFTLDSYYGLDASGSYDREAYVLAIICAKNVFLFAFELREEMIQFEIKIRQSLGEEHHFLVKIVKAPPSTKAPKEQLNLIIHDTRFCLTAQSPPKILLSWNIIDLRRYGLRDGKFCFEGGTNCGKGAGLFALQSDQIETIADIIHFAATGKMSNCHRKFKNRSSQFDLGGHLIADIPSLPSQSSSSHLHHIHHTVAKGPLQGALPATLNCCHDSQTGSAESEDWNWYKRHSVSVMDYRRISALREKAAAETRDQLAMGAYDIPPNHDRRLDTGFPPTTAGEHGYDHPRSLCHGPKNSTGNTYAPCVSDRHEYCNTVVPRSEISGGHYKCLKGSRDSSLKESGELSSFDLDNGEESHSSSMSRNETLQTLKKQEYNIQKEMKLLDEMLLNCSGQNEEMAVSACGGFVPSKCQMSNRASKNISSDLSYANYDEVPMRLKEPVNGTGQDSSVNHHEVHSMGVTSSRDFEIISGNIAVVKANPVCLKNKKSGKLSSHLNKTLPDETPISPLFHAKLNNIPSGSKLNAPLPYVNLSRYDDDSKSHVYLPGSADCLLVARGSSFSSLSPGKNNQSKGRVVWRHHSGSLSSLHTPVAASSLTNLNQFSECSPNKPQSSQARFQLRQAIEGRSFIENDGHGHPEVLVVNLEGKREAWERQKSSSVKLPSEKGSKVSKRDSEIVSLLTSDLNRREQEEQDAQTKNEGIYENLPIAVREDSPPPALPPKGPALLKKLRAAAAAANASTNNNESKYKPSTLSPPTPHRQNRSFSSFHDSSFGYDHNHEGSHQDLSTSEGGQVDENYLHMGSPKTSHKFAATVPMVLPNKKKIGSKYQVRDDYMDMGVAEFEMNSTSENLNHEDEIYLDVEETLKSLTKNPPERRLSGKAVPLGLPPVAGGANRESTYVEMATVSNRKSMVVQNLETLQAYVSKKPGGEKGGSTSPTAATSQPPLPRPYKVRHSSDSGLSSKEIGDLDMNPERTRNKSPMKVYSKVKSSDTVNRSLNDPPLPFQNLMDFTKKTPDSRSTYVNTYIDAERNLASLDDMRSIPLPEPVKEGFLARFKRRSSRDKGSPAPEKTGSGKNRSSILERSMSEHDSPRSNKEEKNSKLKIGRRRSSSFPNRLSYQEAQDDDSHSPTARKDNSSSSSFSSSSVKSKASFNPAEQSESSSSVQDFSDDSDISPLLKRVGRKVKPTAATVLHIQQNQPIDKNLYMHTSRSTSCLISQIPNCSKTDDEKLSEILFKRPSQSRSLKNSSFDDSTMFEVSMERKHKREMTREELKRSKGSASEYCLMDPPKPEKAIPVCVAVDSATGAGVPALPPKSRNYQNLLSPVLEVAAPSIPPRPYPVGAAEPAESESGETIMDQYVELSRSFGNQDDSTSLKNSLDSKAGRLSDCSTGEKTMTRDQTCTTITLPLSQASGYSSDIDISDSPASSTSSSLFEGDSPCANPAKSVLRPRSGREYALIQRVPVLPTFRLLSSSLASFSPTLSHFFNYDLDPQKSSQESTLKKRGSENQCHHHHPHQPHQAACDCTPKSQNSFSVRHTPQRSPSLASNSDTIRSNSSLSHDQKDPHKSIHTQNSRARLTSLSVSTLSSLSPSPGEGASHHQSVPWFNSSDLSAKLSPLESAARSDVFFPDEVSVSTPSDVAQCDPSYSLEEDYHVYVNQEFVFMHQHRKSAGRTGNSFSSHSSASPRLRDMHSCLSLYQDSLQSKNALDATDAPRGTRQRFRHSESDTARAKKGSHSFGAGDRLQKSLTLPSSVHRSHSDPKRGLKSYPHPSRSKSHIHEKKYDKFAQSSIIARRRLQHAPPLIESPQPDSTDRLPVTFDVFSSSSGLQVPALKSSGYKNIDTMKAFPAAENEYPPRNFMHGNASPSPNAFESQLSPGYMDASFLSGNSPVVMTSTPNPAAKVLSPSPMSVTPPPLPPRRLSTSSTISPPLTPRTGYSDSPPPYRAPPPPLLPTGAALSAPREDSLSSGSSDDEAELIYIEVDMTKRQDEAPKVPSVSLSRRTRRAKQQQRDLAKLRYAEIDHTATKALKETSEKFRDDRRSMGGSALGRKGSSFSSKNRKSSYQAERQLSTASIESC